MYLVISGWLLITGAVLLLCSRTIPSPKPRTKFDGRLFGFEVPDQFLVSTDDPYADFAKEMHISRAAAKSRVLAMGYGGKIK